MHQAIARDKQTGETFLVGGTEFEDKFAGHKKRRVPAPVPDWKSRFEFTDADTATIPAYFVPSHSRYGNEKPVSAHFARAAGHGNKDHVFDHEAGQITLRDAVLGGRHILISLNLDLSYRGLNYRDLSAPNTRPLERWMQEHKGRYKFHSVTTVQDLQDVMKDLTGLRPDLVRTGRVSVLYRGAVMPFSEFYLKNEPGPKEALFENMRDLTEALPYGQERAIGFPRLIPFAPTHSTLKDKGIKGLRGNVFYSGRLDRRYLDMVVKSDERDKTGAALQAQFARMSEGGRKGLLVMAAPSITIGPNRDQNWATVRWIVNNFDAQAMPSPKPVPRIAAPEQDQERGPGSARRPSQAGRRSRRKPSSAQGVLPLTVDLEQS